MLPRPRMLLLAALLCLTVGVLDHASTAADVSYGSQAPGANTPATAATGLVTAISAGGEHTCAVRDGGAWCWGRNDRGQLGNGTTTLGGCYCLTTPVAVSGLSSGVSAVSAGGGHGCAVKNGGAWCWGANSYGQLGNGTSWYLPEWCSGTGCSTTPVAASGLATGVSAISAGASHTCAVKDGGAWCWGYNNVGQLGNDSTMESDVPVAVSGLSSGVSAISAGALYTCAVKDGGAWCWGYNPWGQLGNGTTTTSLVPMAVSILSSGVSAIGAGGYGACAVKDGGAWCWGNNSWGQLGAGMPTSGPQSCSGGCSTTPIAVSGLASGVTAISAGDRHNCGVKDGSAWCWGLNDNGRLGNNSIWDSNVPVAVSWLASSVAAVSAGGAHTCGVRDGSAWCWGFNYRGPLGNSSTTESHVPVPVGSDTDGDGMPDDYELAHPCLNPNVADGNVDSDGGGLSNYDEFRLGTDPCALPSCIAAENGLNVCDLQQGDVLLAHNGGIYTAAQEALFDGYWGHAGIYVGDGVVVESYGSVNCGDVNSFLCLGGNPGVQARPMRLSSGESFSRAQNWAIMRPTATAQQKATASQYAIAQIGKGYNWNLVDKERTDAFYCSQLVWRAYQTVGIDLDSNLSALSAIAKWRGPFGLVTGAAVLAAVPPEDIWLSPSVTFVKGGGQGLNPSLFRMLSPANLYVTDPMGRHVGVDPLSGITVNEVPGAFFSGPNSYPQFISLADAEGPWGVSAIGTGTGAYTLQVASYGSESDVITQAAGSTVPGQMDSFVAVGTAPGAAVQLMVDTDHDGMPDSFELAHPCLNSSAADGTTDADGDGISNLDEYRRTLTDPCKPDTDGDSVSDGPFGGAGPPAFSPGPDNCLLTPNADQLNTDAANTALNRPGADALGDACDDDISGDGYGNVKKAALGKNLLIYCPIMRADVDGDGAVSILDLAKVAQYFTQSVPPAPERYKQDADNQISILDLTRMAQVFTQHVSACP
jgi:alpha-tubulin suppressor-like RCC1 family protein